MSEDLRSMLVIAKGKDLEMLGQMVLLYDTQVKRALVTHPDRPGIAAGMHDAMDRAVGQTLAVHPKAGDVKCRKGCDHCCHLNVDITSTEAELLLLAAEDQGVKIDVERLHRQAGRGVEGLRELTREERACVFLKDGACTVYEHRPGACRKLQVVTDPMWCDAVTYPGHEVGRLVTPEAEVTWSVLMTHDKSGSMPDMLLEAMNGKT
jgi:Fe-S-cluster containining protein